MSQGPRYKNHCNRKVLEHSLSKTHFCTLSKQAFGNMTKQCFFEMLETNYIRLAWVACKIRRFLPATPDLWMRISGDKYRKLHFQQGLCMPIESWEPRVKCYTCQKWEKFTIRITVSLQYKVSRPKKAMKTRRMSFGIPFGEQIYWGLCKEKH